MSTISIKTTFFIIGLICKSVKTKSRERSFYTCGKFCGNKMKTMVFKGLQY